MGTKNHGSAADVTKIQNLVAGFEKSMVATSNFVVLGVSMLVSAIIIKLQGYLTLDANTKSTEAAWKAAVAAQRQAEAEAHTFVQSVTTSLKAFFGPGNPVLQTFGIAPPKQRKQRTAEQKATSAALAKRTKGVRGPVGKNQRAAVTPDGKPGMQFVDAQGNVVPGLAKGPTPPAAEPTPPQEPPPAGSNGNGNGSNGSSK
ncbi:MAG: hypothetical protein ACYDCL_02615 [Myxococcales bacterium]